ncbi:MAG: CBM21 domain-containing protein [Oscillospiraceae bacterium]|jgi:hypothetical protein|nr:CBM21 domain-containing protein [Oscillospiraceae bacterium]
MSKRRLVRTATLFISVVFAVAMCVAVVPPAVAVTAEVSLIYAKTYTLSSGGVPPYSFNAGATGYVEVENLAPNKTVTVFYSFDGNTWLSVAAVYVGPTYGNKEAWAFTTSHINSGYRGTVTVYLAIRYDVPGQTYWDNNGGQNYTVYSGGWGAAERVAFGSGALFVRSYGASDTLTGSVVLANLAYQKTVIVRYTTNGWASYTDIYATYGGSNNSDNTEIWNFQSGQLPVNWNEIEFAVLYTVNGNDYWDNNFGANYAIGN